MWKRVFLLGCFGASLGLVFAQQGHPLTGTWNGDWGSTPAQRNQVTLVMKWDGQKVTGLMNPGPDATPLATVTMNPAGWTVRIELDTKDQAGQPVHVVAEGKLDDLGGYHRTITGTWTQGAVKNTFKLTRD